jgi:hypothetical protein
MATLLGTQDFSSAALSAIIGPTITNIQVTNSSYVAQTATALSTISGGYITITGTNFTSTTNVYLDYNTLVPASNVVYISTTQLNVQLSALAAGTYILVLVTSTGGVAIKINAVNYAVVPVWTTSQSLLGYNGVTVNINLSAVVGAGDSLRFAVASGSSLPYGLTLSSNGVLFGAISGLFFSTTYNFTLNAVDSENQSTPQLFSLFISTLIDQYFNQSLLFNGETAATPFISDASNNSNQVLALGVARQDVTNPFYGSGYYSVYFNGTTDYLYGPTNSSGYLEGQGSYTLEGFFNISAIGGGTIASTLGILNTCASTGASSPYHAWGFYNSNQIVISTNNTLTYTYVVLNQILPTNTWFHMAIVYNGTNNTGSIYYNGTLVGTWIDATTYSANSTGIWQVGTMYGTTGYYRGYINSLRFVRNIAVYTGNFVAPTAPILNYTNYTALLLCQNSSFIDNGINTSLVNSAGSVKVVTSIPFAPSSSYSAYGSGYFNGTTDYLTVTSSTNLQFIGSDFTIECFIYLTALPSSSGYYAITSKGSVAGTNFEHQFSIYNNAGSYKLDLQLSTNGTTVLEYQSNNISIVANQWYTISVSKIISTAYFWLNGASAGTAQVTATALYYGSAALYIGALAGATNTNWYTGYLSNLRIIKGTGIYYLAYTPSTAQLTNISNTQLLTLQYNGPTSNSLFLDSSPFNNILTKTGNPSVGSFTPFTQNGWSYYFDGSTGYIYSSSSTSTFNLSSVAFTVEAYIYVSVITGTQYVCNLSNGLNVASGFTFGVSGGYPYVGNGSTGVSGSIAINANAWNHICAVSNGTTVAFYTNGVANSTTYTFAPNTASYVYLGRDGTGANGLSGYISNLRIVSGVQVYTASFTPSTAPLSTITGTILLTAQSNRLLDSSFTNTVLVAAGIAQVQAFSPFVDNTNIPTAYSLYFPGGTSTYITTVATQIIPASTSYTIEAWINISTYTGSPVILSQGTTGNAGRTSLFVNSSGYLSFGIGGTNVTSTGTVPLYAWTYIAIVVQGTAITFYINNSASGTASAPSGTPQNSALVIGADWQSSPSITGYATNIRISNTVRNIYTAPTSTLLSDTNTNLLLTSNTVVDSSSYANTLIITGSPYITAFTPYTYLLTQPVSYTTSVCGGSIYFNGATDYLTVPANANYNFGTGNFTVEFWVYPNNLPTNGTTYSLVDFWNNVNGNYIYGATTQWTTVIYSSGALEFIYATGLSTIVTVQSAKTISANSWSHIAFVRNANTLYIYINGVADTITGNLTGINIGYTAYGGNIGVETNTKAASTYFSGYMSNIRINTYALYSAPFYPPTAPFTGTVSGTILLLNATQIGINDASGRTNLIAFNSVASTGNYKFGLSAMYFNGVNSFLAAPYNVFYNLYAGNFTVDFWIFVSSVIGTQQIVSQYNSAAYNWGIALVGSTMTYSLSSSGSNWNIANNVTMGTVSTGSWIHVALVRNGNTFTPYLNGVSGTTSTSNNALFVCTTPLTVGALYNSGVNTFDSGSQTTLSNYFSGYIDDLRLTKGVARYASTFTPPTYGDYTQ